MFEKFFGKKGKKEPDKVKIERISPDNTEKMVASKKIDVKDVKDLDISKSKSSDSYKKAVGGVADKELHSGYISPYTEKKLDKGGNNNWNALGNEVAKTKSSSALPVTNFVPKEDCDSTEAKKEIQTIDTKETKPGLEDRIFIDEEKPKSQSKGVVPPSTSKFIKKEEPFRKNFYKDEAVTFIFLQKGIFNTEEKFMLHCEKIANNFFKSITDKYFKNGIFKFSFGNVEDSNLEYVGQNLVDVFKYITSINTDNLKKATSDTPSYFNIQKCVQIIILGDGDVSNLSKEDTDFIKYAIEKLIQKNINTYYITSNKYTFADIAALGFRNVESTNHDYNNI